MNYIAETELIRVEISDKGAELQSIILKSDGCEYLWQGDEKYWDGRAYNLFPICGRVVDGKYIYKGKTYDMPIHGFAKDSVFKAEQKSAREIAFTLVPNDEIRAMYPFDFEYRVTYILEGDSIETVYDVKNNGENDMYFAVGAHPGFNVPLTESEKFDDYYLEFDCAKQVRKLIFTPFYNTGRTEPYELKDGKIIELSHAYFGEKANFFTDISRGVTLKSRVGTKSVRVEYPEMQNIGFWHLKNSDAPYVCIEPWCSVPSMDGGICDLEKKEQMTCISKGEKYRNGFKIIIK